MGRYLSSTKKTTEEMALVLPVEIISSRSETGAKELSNLLN